MSQDYKKLLKAIKGNETLSGLVDEIKVKSGDTKKSKSEDKKPEAAKVVAKEEVVIVKQEEPAKEEVKVEEVMVKTEEPKA